MTIVEDLCEHFRGKLIPINILVYLKVSFFVFSFAHSCDHCNLSLI